MFAASVGDLVALRDSLANRIAEYTAAVGDLDDVRLEIRVYRKVCDELAALTNAVVVEVESELPHEARNEPPVNEHEHQREGRTPPHVSLRTLRNALGMTLEDVSDRVREHAPELTASCGTLSAIESGSRGASPVMLRALRLAYGLGEGELTTDYRPRLRGVRNEVA